MTASDRDDGPNEGAQSAPWLTLALVIACLLVCLLLAALVPSAEGAVVAPR